MAYMGKIAKHIREFYFGKNWTWSDLTEQLSDVSYAEAIFKIDDVNTILDLTFHIHYYVQAVTKVLLGGPLEAHDKYSFMHPEINTKEEWKAFKNNIFIEAEQFAKLVEALPDNKIDQLLDQEKYGDYFRNLHGVIEHGYYHLGQIVILKKLIRSKSQ